MLGALRNSVNTWTAKILLALLVISFAAWGISDVFINRTATTVATVGEAEISTQEFATALSDNIRDLQRRTGRAISVSEAREAGLDQMVMARITTQAALDEEARAFGISASPAAIRTAIENSPAFQNISGQFDRFSYESRLQYQGLNTREFEETVREDLSREAMLQVVGVGTSAPRVLAETLHRFRAEQRVFEYIALDLDSAPDPGEPTAEQLAAFHKDNAAQFSAPEYRKINAAWMTDTTIAAGIEIEQDRIVQAYGARSAEFTTPATRTVDQLLFKTEEAATAAETRISGGEPFGKVAQEIGGEAALTSLGTVPRSGLPEVLANAAFDAKEPGVIGPVKTVFGWTLLNISAVQLESIRPLEDVQDQIRNDLALIEARTLMGEESVAFDDEIAGGASLQEVANRTVATYLTLDAVDENGLDSEGNAITTLPTVPGFLTSVFGASVDEDPIMIEADGGGIYAFKVEEITEAALRDLDTVKDEVTAAWQRAQREQALIGQAAAIKTRLEAGETLADIAEEREATTAKSPPLRRSSSSGVVSEAITAKMFASAIGDAIEGSAATGDGSYLIGTLAEIVDAGADAENDAIDRVAEGYSRQMANDMVQTFSRSAMDRHPTLIYPGVVDATLSELGQRY